MKKGYALVVGLTLLALSSASALAAGPAPKTGCIELKSVAETEESYRDDNGQQAVRRVPAAKVVPGTQVIWTLSATNICATAADKVFIDNPVPGHMTLIADSVRGAGADISFTISKDIEVEHVELTLDFRS